MLVDGVLFTAIDVALASSTPTAALFHTAYTIFRGGPLVEMFAPGLAIANAHRAELDLPAIERLGDIHDACGDARSSRRRRSSSPTRRTRPTYCASDQCSTHPRCRRGTDRRGRGQRRDDAAGPGLSQRERAVAGDLLQRCVDAVAQLPVRAIVTTGASIDPASVNTGANTRVARYVPHAILTSASLVITHAGLEHTMAALGRGVPLLCTPMGRDQFFNAEQVEALEGTGRMLMPDSSSEAIAQAAAEILGDDRFNAGAKQLAVAIGELGGAAAAAAALESLG